MHQLSMFDALHSPPVRRPVDPNGPVIKGDVAVFLFLKHPKLAWNRAEIKVHPGDDALWMWSTSWCLSDCGGGYQVGPKWGNFAETKEDAIYWAACELEDRLSGHADADASTILAWVRRIKDNPGAFSEARAA